MSIIVKKTYSEEAIQGYNLRTAREEARRCLICHDAPCSKSCPAGTDPANFIQSLRFNNVKGAAETIRKNNPLAGTCARICPYDKLCQEACSRCGIDRPIEIGKLQRFIVEQEQTFGMKTLEVIKVKKKKKVACVGAGPASLTVAAKLSEAGHEVTIFEEKAKAGGVLRYGIVPTRLPEKVVNYDLELIEKLGVKFQYNTKITAIDKLKKDFDVVFVGAGLWASKRPEILEVALQGVWFATEYLKTARETKGNFNSGKNVIVIGGGDVAMDCAATAKLTGAEKVMVYYRRTIEEAPANIEEVKYVQAMGVTITTEFIPLKIMEENGKTEFVEFRGRDGFSSAKIKADTVIFAIGQEPEDMNLLGDFRLNKKGCIIADEKTGMTNIVGVFAAGDIVNGGETVVEAVARGKATADAIVEYLEREEGEK